MRTNFILVDHESVHALDESVFGLPEARVIVFIGPNQKKIATGLAIHMHGLGERACYVQMASSGPNALDFHIAYYLGRLAQEHPDAFFHVISKDTGFDPLIVHLKAKKIRAARHCCVSELPIVKTVKAKSVDERVDLYVAKLRQPQSTKPRTIKTLGNAIRVHFQATPLSDSEVDAIVQRLQKSGLLRIDGTKLTYAL